MRQPANSKLKRAAVPLAAFCLMVAIIAFTTLWEPGSVTIKADKVGGVAFLLFIVLMWYGNSRSAIAN
jgi:hypothetical protein